MIQRIQSLLLFGAAILLTVNLFIPIWSSAQAGVPVVLRAFSVDYGSNPSVDTSVPSTLVSKPIIVAYIGVLMVVCIGLALYIIFRFNNRVLQLRLCNLLTLLIFSVIGTYFIAIVVINSTLVLSSEGAYEAGYFLPVLCGVLVLVAKYFIRKDDNLVKSVDRIR